MGVIADDSNPRPRLSGPCSACGDGDVNLRFHSHDDVERQRYTLDEIERLARRWRDENEATNDAQWIVTHLLAWLRKQERIGRR